MAEHENLDLVEEQIRARIERTRAHMGETIEEIGERLNIDRLKREFKAGVRDQVEHTKREIRGATIGKAENLIHNVEETVNQTSRTLFDTIRDNPVPAAMAGIGLGWLIADARRHQTHYDTRYYEREYPRAGMAGSAEGYRGEGYMSTAGYYTPPPMTSGEWSEGRSSQGADSVRDKAEHAADRARDTASDMAEQTRDMAGRVQESAASAAQQAQERASRMMDRVHDTADDAWSEAQHHARRAQRAMQGNPLAAGAVALALGFAAGMVIPETPQEDRWMGSTRDRLMDRAEDAARKMGDKVERIAEKTAEQAKETAQREASREGLTGKSGGSTTGASGGSTMGASGGSTTGSSGGSTTGASGGSATRMT